MELCIAVTFNAESVLRVCLGTPVFEIHLKAVSKTLKCHLLLMSHSTLEAEAQGLRIQGHTNYIIRFLFPKYQQHI